MVGKHQLSASRESRGRIELNVFFFATTSIISNSLLRMRFQNPLICGLVEMLLWFEFKVISSVTFTEMAIWEEKKRENRVSVKSCVLKCVKLQRQSQTSKQKAGMGGAGLD